MLHIPLVLFPLISRDVPSFPWMVGFSSQGLTSWSRCRWFLTRCQCWERRTGRTCYRWHLGCSQTCKLVWRVWITRLLSFSSEIRSRTLEMFHCHSFPGDAFIHQSWVESEKAVLWIAARRGFSRWDKGWRKFLAWQVQGNILVKYNLSILSHLPHFLSQRWTSWNVSWPSIPWTG